tara:strand:+ start:141 stop:1244 length:1104 start_codon:yes stop_codon:yes gene_type:complete
MNLLESFKELPLWSQLTLGGATLAGAFMVIGEMRNNHLIEQSAEQTKKETGPEWVRRKMKPYRMDPERKRAEYQKGTQGPCWDGYTYVGDTPYSKGSCVKNAESFANRPSFTKLGTLKQCEKYISALRKIQMETLSPDEMLDWRDVGETIKDELHKLDWRIEPFDNSDEFEDYFGRPFEAPLFNPSDDDDNEGDFNPHESYDCHVCDRPYEFSKIARSLAQHYLKESDGGEKDWYHSKKNPEGIRKTARNIAGYELYYYGMQALEHYMSESKPSKLRETVIELLRKAIVPNIIVGDVVQFIETLEIDGVEDLDPKFSKEFSEGMAAESESCDCETPRPRHAGVHPRSCMSCDLIIEAEQKKMKNFQN